MNDDFSNDLLNVVKFHGHICGGLLIGVFMSRVIQRLFREKRSVDEELVAISEGDFCMVDGLQYLLGTTLGKGNLILKPYGKAAASFYNRKDGSGYRLSVKRDHLSP